MTDEEFVNAITSLRFTPIYAQARVPSADQRWSLFLLDRLITVDLSESLAADELVALRTDVLQKLAPLLESVRFAARQQPGLPFESVTEQELATYRDWVERLGRSPDGFFPGYHLRIEIFPLIECLLAERDHLHALLRDLAADGALQHYQAGIEFAEKRIRQKMEEFVRGVYPHEIFENPV